MIRLWNWKELLNCLVLSLIISLFFVGTLNKCAYHLDRATFLLLNSLLINKDLQYIIGYLNHSYEKIINIFFMLLLNYFAYKQSSKQLKNKVAIEILTLWLTLELWLLVINFITRDLLDITRLSPSLILPVKVWLNKSLGSNEIKVTATTSFPGGHAFVAFYWFFYSLRFSLTKVNVINFFIALLISLPRIFSGAHWLSDILFSIFLAYLFVKIDFATPIWYYSSRLFRFLIANGMRCIKKSF